MDWFHLLTALLLISGGRGAPAESAKDVQQRHDRYVALLRQYFWGPRHAFVNEDNWLRARAGVIGEFEAIIGNVANTSLEIHHFETEVIVESNIPAPVKGQNIIVTFNGENRWTDRDELVVIGAHYDSDATSNGLDDNGSGVVALLETARWLADAILNRKARLLNTVIFVAFDVQKLEHENVGSLDHGPGSHFYVQEKLSAILNSTPQPGFRGAIILDSVLNYNGTARSQVLPNGFDISFPEGNRFILDHNNTGNFLTMVTKERLRSLQLDNMFSQQWQSVDAQQSARSPLLTLEIQRNRPSPAIYEFLKNDHLAFWNYMEDNDNRPLPAILLTDTGKWRSMTRNCGDIPCDLSELVNQDRLKMLDHVVKTVNSYISGSQLAEPDVNKPSGSSSHQTATYSAIVITFLLSLLLH